MENLICTMERIAALIAVAVVLSVAQEKSQPFNTFKLVRNVKNTLNEGQNRRQLVEFDYESPNYRTQQRAPRQSSSCENLLEYRRDSRGNYGFLRIQNPDYTINNLTLEMTLASLLPSTYLGEIVLAKSFQSSASDIEYGRPLIYRVKFPVQNLLPKLTAVYHNNQLICTSEKEVAQFMTNLKLDHTFITGLPPVQELYPPADYQTNPPVYAQPTQALVAAARAPATRAHLTRAPATRAPSARAPAMAQTSPPVYETAAPVYTTRRTARPAYMQATTEATQQVDYRVEDFECGIPDYQTPTITALIVGGHEAHRGQFPWLAAYYHNGEGHNGFICGGSLVSPRIVVTAAHCVQAKSEVKKRKAEASSFYLGKFNLDSLHSEQGFITSGVSQLLVHPEWNYSEDRFDADIAIAILIRTISFNKFIKPVCLWTSSTSYEDLVGQKAIIAGWGKTEFNAVSTDRPKWTEIPVVDTLTCIRSNFALNDLTSDRTFCAGDPSNNNGPCNGDSGGGLTVQHGTKWYLRGIISSSLFNATISMCDTSNFAVFTDVAKYVPWVQGYIQTYG